MELVALGFSRIAPLADDWGKNIWAVNTLPWGKKIQYGEHRVPLRCIVQLAAEDPG